MAATTAARSTAHRASGAAGDGNVGAPVASSTAGGATAGGATAASTTAASTTAASTTAASGPSAASTSTSAADREEPAGLTGTGDAAGSPSTNAHRAAEPSVPAEPAPEPVPDGVIRRVARGSPADLRQRLELLPPGHPSSPYHDDGKPKPPPPRLRHLELAPPRERPPDAPRPGAATLAEFSQPASTHKSDPRPGHGTPLLPRETSHTAEPRTEPDGSWNWGAAMLTAAESRSADEAYARLRGAEGRDSLGGYRDVGIAPTLRRVEAGLEDGWLAPDAGRSALADPDKFKAELARLIEQDPLSPPARLAARVRNALSYAFVFPIERYSMGVRQVQEALLAEGFVLIERRNDWGAVAGKCVVMIWREQVHDLLFQVQVHTPASLEARELARTSAALISDPRIPFAEVAHLRADLAAAWAALPAPPGNAAITSYRA